MANVGRQEESGGRGKGELLGLAVAHPVRRRILRSIAGEGEGRSPAQIARSLDLPVAVAVYQMTVLSKCRALRPAGEGQAPGGAEALYDAMFDGDASLEALLEQTREADERTG
jgi:hypothetical protein